MSVATTAAREGPGAVDHGGLFGAMGRTAHLSKTCGLLLRGGVEGVRAHPELDDHLAHLAAVEDRDHLRLAAHQQTVTLGDIAQARLEHLSRRQEIKLLTHSGRETLRHTGTMHAASSSSCPRADRQGVNELVQQAVTEAERVEDWRLHVLINAGYPIYLAEQLATRSDVDLHQAVELAQAGCDHKTAAKILL
jgi:hypothetical protein